MHSNPYPQLFWAQHFLKVGDYPISFTEPFHQQRSQPIINLKTRGNLPDSRLGIYNKAALLRSYPAHLWQQGWFWRCKQQKRCDTLRMQGNWLTLVEKQQFLMRSICWIQFGAKVPTPSEKVEFNGGAGGSQQSCQHHGRVLLTSKLDIHDWPRVKHSSLRNCVLSLASSCIQCC